MSLHLGRTWYELFSRGARDWLRHNAKMREAIGKQLPELLAAPDVLTSPQGQTVRVALPIVEHARFRLRDPDTATGVGHGAGEAGKRLHVPSAPSRADPTAAGHGESSLRVVLELNIDELLEWLWEDLDLPDLTLKAAPSEIARDYTRAGWQRRGVRARLDRRRTLKEALKRRAVQNEPLAFVDEDLRFRQLIERPQPALSAAVLLLLDVSGSMAEPERRLAKAFFFVALQGLRRRYPKVEVAFVAHASEAWEFSEERFFQTAGAGGTVSSTAFRLALDIVHERFDPARYNVYLFYASDGENVMGDWQAATALLHELGPVLNYGGYIEVRPEPRVVRPTAMGGMFTRLEREGLPFGMARVTDQEDVWEAVRRFFRHELEATSVSQKHQHEGTQRGTKVFITKN